MPANDSESRTVEIDGETIELRNPAIAAVLAWLLPGAGHFYQRRYRKGVLFSVCILLTYFVGFVIGGGHVVYASWTPGDHRYHYVAQVGVGLPALPALAQAFYLRSHVDESGIPDRDYLPLWNGTMAPPRPPIFDDNPDQLSDWHRSAGAGFELGSWYTMVAGLLNVLVIFDAYAGPLAIPISGKSQPPPGESESGSGEGAAGDRKKKRKQRGS